VRLDAKRRVVLLAALLAGCVTGSGAPAPRATTTAPAQRLLVALERERCFGACPAYRLEIDTDGAVRYEGRWNVCKDGASGRLSREKLAELRATIARSGFATTPVHCCDCPTADTGGLTLTVAEPAPPKTIVDAELCEGAPTTVRDLAQAIDAIVDIERWIGTDEDRAHCWF